MPEWGNDQESRSAALVAADADDSAMVAQIRVLLAVSMLLAVMTDAHGAKGLGSLPWQVTFWYLVHSVAVYVLLQNRRVARVRILHWCDVFWYVLIVYAIGGVESNFFFLFCFAILTASFNYGFEEGARVTIVSVALFAAGSLTLRRDSEISVLLLRATFLLSVGYVSAHWGESMVGTRRRLALLRDVSRLSNPRFGTDHTITSVMEKIRAFFGGDASILVTRDRESDAYSLRMAKDGQLDRAIDARHLYADAARPLMAFQQSHIVFHVQPFLRPLSLGGCCLVFESSTERWSRIDPAPGRNLAELFEARAFISAPLSLRHGDGRIYVTSRRRRFEKSDAMFLGHIVTQAFAVIDHIELLDHIASDAAVEEREKIARDLHDTVIQPYLGLRLGLSAVRNKAASGNPLAEDLDRLIALTEQVIDELRGYAGTFRDRARLGRSVFLATLNRKADQLRESHGVEIEVIMEGAFCISDRLAAEALHVVNEGLSNICKHTAARRGSVRILCDREWLRIRIENEAKGASATGFMPRSIAQRAAALGGRVSVRQEAAGCVAVHIERFLFERRGEE
jgi:signal transduction histidine kinase